MNNTAIPIIVIFNDECENIIGIIHAGCSLYTKLFNGKNIRYSITIIKL